MIVTHFHLSGNVWSDLCVRLAPDVKRRTNWIRAMIISHSRLTSAVTSSFIIHISQVQLFRISQELKVALIYVQNSYCFQWAVLQVFEWIPVNWQSETTGKNRSRLQFQSNCLWSGSPVDSAGGNKLPRLSPNHTCLCCKYRKPSNPAFISNPGFFYIRWLISPGSIKSVTQRFFFKFLGCCADVFFIMNKMLILHLSHN